MRLVGRGGCDAYPPCRPQFPTAQILQALRTPLWPTMRRICADKAGSALTRPGGHCRAHERARHARREEPLTLSPPRESVGSSEVPGNSPRAIRGPKSWCSGSNLERGSPPLRRPCWFRPARALWSSESAGVASACRPASFGCLRGPAARDRRHAPLRAPPAPYRTRQPRRPRLGDKAARVRRGASDSRQCIDPFFLFARAAATWHQT